MLTWFKNLPGIHQISLVGNAILLIALLSLGIGYAIKSGDYNTLNVEYTSLKEKYDVLLKDKDHVVDINHQNNDTTKGLNDYYQGSWAKLEATDNALSAIDRTTQSSLRSLDMASIDCPPVKDSILTSKQLTTGTISAPSKEAPPSDTLDTMNGHSGEVYNGQTAKTVLKIKIPQELISIVNNTGS